MAFKIFNLLTGIPIYIFNSTFHHTNPTKIKYLSDSTSKVLCSSYIHELLNSKSLDPFMKVQWTFLF